MCEQIKSIAVAREKVFLMFGSDSLKMFDEVLSFVEGEIIVEECRVSLYDKSGTLRFRAGNQPEGDNLK
ncbi:MULTISPECIES: hypothetical protein [Pantoea]|uniref:hypothetical protein n=1 Tax=Pantoea TaxID=53335 RepID=UPI00226986C1|nr:MULTISPECIES: hypothetical protein [Pantoea]MDR6295409.1 hypothetical protein [Pantoea dispersa]